MQRGTARQRAHQFVFARAAFAATQSLCGVRCGDASLVASNHGSLQVHRMLQAVHKLVMVVHHFGLHLGVGAHTPAVLCLLRIALQLLHLIARRLLGTQRILQQPAGFIALALGQVDGDRQST